MAVSGSKTDPVDAGDKEKQVESEMAHDPNGLGPMLGEIKTAKPSRTNTRTPTVSRTTTRRSQRSYYGGQDGYSCQSEEMPVGGGEQSDDESFDVKWDGGDADPLNPRHKSKLHKWIIVLILSSAALCV